VTATFAKPATAWLVAALTIGFEIAIRVLTKDPSWGRAVAVHATIAAAFVTLNAIALRGRIEAIGTRARRRLEREVERMREQARSYRLHEPSTPRGPENDKAAGDGTRGTSTDPTAVERLARSGVEEIQVAVRFALDLLKRSLDAHSAVLLFESTREGGRTPTTPAEGGQGRMGSLASGATMRCAEVVSDAPAIAEGPFGMGDGVLGAVMRRKATVALQGLRAGYRIPYYPAALASGGPTSIVAAPIMEAGAVRGVLCVDRLPRGTGETQEDRPFSAHEEDLVGAAARYILRAIENERVFGRLERAKAEQDQLYAAAQRLSGALTEAEVLEAGVESARAIASFDLAAITIVHEGPGESGRVHEVRAVAGAADFESLVGLRFGDNGGLVAQAVKSRHSLPHRGDHDAATQVVFTRRHPLRVALAEEEELGGPASDEVRSILVVPLILRERALGTLVLGARRRGAFRDLRGANGARTTLEVLASHLATSLANARMFAKLEELATTDGLTGLLNKRVLLELGAQKVRAAARYGKPLSVIQTDIDHFKNINDTHGHDVGDQVIKGLAGILRRLKRATDYVARFGGEEFVVICEETDAGGATQLAERVREELARTTFHASGPSGPVAFQVTCSLGVATFPRDGETWETLYKATDEALYASKRGGRNRTTLASDLPLLSAAAKTA
jgi:two-component system, cell cycle response regulator